MKKRKVLRRRGNRDDPGGAARERPDWETLTMLMLMESCLPEPTGRLLGTLATRATVPATKAARGAR